MKILSVFLLVLTMQGCSKSVERTPELSCYSPDKIFRLEVLSEKREFFGPPDYYIVVSVVEVSSNKKFKLLESRYFDNFEAEWKSDEQLTLTLPEDIFIESLKNYVSSKSQLKVLFEFEPPSKSDTNKTTFKCFKP